MLKIVKTLVDNTPEKPFGQFYIEYIMQVQDSNIDREIKNMVRKHRPDLNLMQRVIENTYKYIKKG